MSFGNLDLNINDLAASRVIKSETFGMQGLPIQLAQGRLGSLRQLADGRLEA